MRRLAIPFAAGLVLVVAGVAAYRAGRDDSTNSAVLETVGTVCMWVGLAAIAAAVVLAAVYGLTRFVVWSSRR